MNRLSILLIALLLPMGLQSQVKKVAMLEPLGEATAMQKAIIRASLAEAITNVEGYEALSRTDIDQIMNEFDFQRGGMVSDEQRQRLGRMSGAELLCITRLTVDGNDFFVESSLIVVETGAIFRTANELMTASPTDKLREGCIHLAAKLVGQVSGSSTSGGGSTSSGDTTPQSSSGGTKRNGASYNPDGIELVYVEGGSGIITHGFYIGKFEIGRAHV